MSRLDCRSRKPPLRLSYARSTQVNTRLTVHGYAPVSPTVASLGGQLGCTCLHGPGGHGTSRRPLRAAGGRGRSVLGGRMRPSWTVYGAPTGHWRRDEQSRWRLTGALRELSGRSPDLQHPSAPGGLAADPQTAAVPRRPRGSGGLRARCGPAGQVVRCACDGAAAVHRELGEHCRAARRPAVARVRPRSASAGARWDHCGLLLGHAGARPGRTKVPRVPGGDGSSSQVREAHPQ